MQELKFHYLLLKFQTSPVQTSQRAYSAQTGDEWSRQWRRRGRRGRRAAGIKISLFIAEIPNIPSTN
jgi:hypothetical protein